MTILRQSSPWIIVRTRRDNGFGDSVILELPCSFSDIPLLRPIYFMVNLGTICIFCIIIHVGIVYLYQTRFLPCDREVLGPLWKPAAANDGNNETGGQHSWTALYVTGG